MLGMPKISDDTYMSVFLVETETALHHVTFVK